MRNPAFKAKGIRKKATSYKKSDESIIFTLHNTPIVTITPYNIILNSGGYKTVTTKRRMNQISSEFGLGFNVSSIKGEWMVFSKGYWHVFADRMVLSR